MDTLFAPLLAVQYLLFFIVSIIPVWNRRHQGCDSYYFLLTAEILRKNRRIPVVLPPYYLADTDEQWYPPGFTLFLSMFPEKVLQRYHWLINYVLDFFNLLAMDLFMLAAFQNYEAILIANVVYIFTPVSAKEYFSLTSRPLGNLLFSLYMIFLFTSLHTTGGLSSQWGMLFLTCGLWVAILLTHKLTVQLGLFLAVVLSFGTGSWQPAAVAISGIPLAILLTGGFYWKVLKGHWDIVSFWHRNISLLEAHQVYDSPLYGNAAGPGTPGENSTYRTMARRGLSIISYSPFLLFIFYLSPALSSASGESKAVGFLALWTGGTIAWAILTTFVPLLWSLGQGYRYVKYAVLPSSALIGLAYENLLPIDKAVLSSLFIFSLVCMYRSWRSGGGGASASHQDSDFLDLAAYLGSHPPIDRIGCLSSHLCDPIVYFARKKVLWGTHHYHFNDKVVRFFPVLRHSPAELSKMFDLHYWCVDTNYAQPSDVGLTSELLVKSFGPYSLYRAPR